ncbi:MFS transporter [Thermopolyspora sp. NPDC052614]|uniref:MFS transporter n=1 Tax=Thermopolyspora sp. NPDC052614 TaxID=3155682 RepID=UPI00343B0243
MSESAGGPEVSPVRGDDTAPVASRRRLFAALVALSTGAFCFVTAELLPIGLLTLISRDLRYSESETGLLVTGYAVVVIIASVPLTRLTQRLPRRGLLGGTLVVFVVSTLLSATATGYAVLLAARLLTALGQALFWSIAGPTVAALFPPEVRGRVVSQLAIGASLAPVLGVPVGVWLGQSVGWRAPFAVLAGLGLLTGLAMVASLPGRTAQPAGSMRGSAPDARRYAILMIVTALAVTGTLTAYTYVTPYLLRVADFAPASLGPLLLVNGIAGVVAASSISAFVDRRPRLSLAVPLAVTAVAWLTLYAFGTVQAAVVAALVLVGLGFNALPPAIASRILRVAPGSVDVASAGGSSAFNVGIAAGSLFGGLLLSGPGVRILPLVAAVLTALALALLLAEPRLARRSHQGPARAAAPMTATDPTHG